MIDSFKKMFEILSSKDKRTVFVLFLMMVVMGFFNMVGVAAVMPFMSILLNPNKIFEVKLLHSIYQHFNFDNTNHFLLFLGLIILGVMILSTTFNTITIWCSTRYAYLNEYTLSKKLLTKYLKSPYEFFLNRNSSELSSNILFEVNKIITFAFMPALQMIAKAIELIFIISLLCWINFSLAFLTVVFLGGSFSVIYLLVRKKLSVISQKHVKDNHARYKIVNEALGGIKDIKLLNKEEVFLDSYSIPAKQFAEHMATYQAIAYVPRYALEALAFGAVLLIVIYYLSTNQNITDVIPILALYAFSCVRLMPVLQTIFASFTTIRICREAISHLSQNLDRYQEDIVTVNENILPPLPFKNELKCKDVTFSYVGTKKTVIDGLNLIIPAKSTVGFVGKTGSGKTTIADLILGLLKLQKGEILIDDIPLAENNLKAWQKKLGYVPQTIFLTDSSIMHNIAFGVPDSQINLDDVIKAAKTANLHDFVINELPDGYNTNVGDRGVRLSGGQRQRIGIARSLYQDPEVLVLDEATSSLDGLTENVIMEAVNQLSRKKTIIIIAHRLTTVKNCDIIYVFENGKVKKSDNYDALMQSDLLFKAAKS